MISVTPPAEKLQNFFGVFLQFHFGVDMEQEQPEDVLERPWIASLLEHGKLTELDRTTIAETVKEILIFEDGHIDITYLFSDELGILNSVEENR